MLKCPNKSSEEWGNLVQAVGEKDAYLLWASYDGEVPERFYAKPEILGDVTVEPPMREYPPLGILVNDYTDPKGPTALEDLINDTSRQGNGYRDIHESILFNGLEGKSSFNAVDVLKNITKSSQFELGEQDKFFIEQAQKLLEKTGAKVKMMSANDFYELDEDFTDRTIMSYDNGSNTIHMSRDVMSDFTPEMVVSAFIHEVSHSTTVQAYKKPSNTNEKLLKETIDKGFQQFKKLANPKMLKEQGFDNPIEFISEIYANPDFRANIQTVDSFWREFLNSIRRLFNMVLNKQNTDYISSAVLFDAVDSFVTMDKTSWRGTQQGQEFFQKKVTEDLFTDLSTTESRIDNVIERFNESIQHSIDHLKRLANNKNNKNSEGTRSYLKSLYELQDDIKINSDANKAKSIIDFAEYMSSNLDRIEKALDNTDLDNIDAVKSTVRTYNNYLSLYSVIDDAISSVNEMIDDDTQKFIKPKELQSIKLKLSANKGRFESIKDRMKSFNRKALARRINDIKYFPDIEKKHNDRLAKEHRAAKIPENKDIWIAKQMNGRDKSLIEVDVREKINAIIMNPSVDTYAADVVLSSAINVSDPFIQILNQFLQEIDNDRLKTERAKDIEFRDLYEKLVTEKGTNNIKSLYENILQYDENGKAFLRSEYDANLYTQVYQKIQSIRRDFNKDREAVWKDAKEISKITGTNSTQYKAAMATLKALKTKRDADVKAIEKANFNLDRKGKFVSIKDKWKIKHKSLSKAEQEVLDFFVANTEEGNKATDGKASLIKFAYKAKFYELPKIHKSTTERILTGQGKGLLADKWKDLTTVRPDDLTNTGSTDSKETKGKDIGLDNKPINSLKIAFRDNIKPEDQSMDLMGIYRLEFKNSNGYKVKKGAEMDMNIMADVVKNKKFYDKAGTMFVLKNSTGKINIKEEGTSNTLKMVNNMIEQRFYGVYKKSDTKIAGMDANKFIQNLNGISSFLALTGNVASSTLNVANANAQLFFESFIKGQYITASGIAKANAVWTQHLGSTIADHIKPINESFVNQLMEEFNVDGLIHLSDSNFLQTDLLKKSMSKDTLTAVTASGEAYVKAVISMSVLDGVKVMDDNFNFIDKDGKIVDESKAASLLDMYSPDPDTGLLTISDKVIYTTNSKTTKYHEGGKDKVDALIYKKMYDSIGNYRQTDQPDLYRHWWGNMAGLYRKYLIPMGTARFRGIENVLTKSEDLRDDQRSFSYALQEYEEGTYVSVLRFIATALREKKYYILSKSNWDNLSDYEKHNIKRSVVEMVTIFALLPIVTMLASGAADGDDDEALYFLAYASRRLETELSQYISIEENFKVLRSPIPSTRLIETALDLTSKVFNPFNWDELGDEYEKGSHKGENKIKIKVEKQVPILKEFIKSYQDQFEYQNSNWGTSVH